MNNNKIMTQIIIIYVYKIFRLIIIITTISYFLGTIWFIFVRLTNEPPGEVNVPFTFYNEYGLKDNDNIKKYISYLTPFSLIIVVYFAFTTLSTVGFGDYNPKSDMERIITCFVLLIGVTIFTIMMNSFIDILLDFNKVNGENEDSDALTKWINMLSRFNKGRNL